MNLTLKFPKILPIENFCKSFGLKPLLAVEYNAYVIFTFMNSHHNNKLLHLYVDD